MVTQGRMIGGAQPGAMSAPCLAYLGDAVFELWVRAYLLEDGNRSIGELNRLARRFVSAGAQAAFYSRIYDLISEEEQAILKRGRNHNPSAKAKNASMTEYRHATGLEALFGYLYAEGRFDRINEIFALCVEMVLNGKENWDENRRV